MNEAGGLLLETIDRPDMVTSSSDSFAGVVRSLCLVLGSDSTISTSSRLSAGLEPSEAMGVSVEEELLIRDRGRWCPASSIAAKDSSSIGS